MNANRYRLVWNSETNMLIPVWEGARARGKGSVKRTVLAACAALLSTGLGAADLPVLNGVVVGNGKVNFQYGAARLDVNLGIAKSIVHWNSFGIAQGNTVSFNNTIGGTVSSLNRVVGLDKSQIDGVLKTSGAVNLMLINTNGIIFGKNAQVDVHTLIASALDIPDATFLNSIFSQAGCDACTKLTETFSGSGNATVEVEQGAVISTENVKGGKIVLIAPGGVENRGTIKTPDGQTILAAGTKVYFVPSEDTRMRGWLVQVDNGGKATNLGDITAERGNVSMVGLTVTQGKNITATTSVGANGSIWLIAGSEHKLYTSGDARTAVPTRGGSVEFSNNSLTQVLADETDIDSIDSNTTFNLSQVLAVGAKVDHYGTILAPGGKVSMVAMADPSLYFAKEALKTEVAIDAYNALPRNDANRVTLHENSVVDVSGYDVELPMSRNVIEVELRDQLKDSPLQRNSFLRGKKVKVDVRLGTPLADISTDLAAIKRGVKEKLSVGGSFESVAQGDTIVKPNAVVDVSGGTIHYAEGLIQTTKLQGMDGKLYDISVADPNRLYRAIVDEFTVSNSKFGSKATKTFSAHGTKQKAYIDAQNAGSVTIQSHGIALAGQLKGAVAEASAEQLSPKLLFPQGGLLELKSFKKDTTLLSAGDKRQDVTWQNGAVTLNIAEDGSLPEEAGTRISTDLLTSGGFSRVSVDRDGKIEVPKGVDLDLAAGGSLTLKGNGVTVAGDIHVPAGTVLLQASSNRNKTLGTLSIAGGSTISVAGLWINEWSKMAGANTLPWLIDAGSITLSGNLAGGLGVGEVTGNATRAAVLDLTGGGRVDVDGKIKGGKGGSLTAKGTLQWVADVRAKGVAGGGTFDFSAANILLRQSAPTLAELASSSTLVLPAAMFSTLGFSRYQITANNLLEVAAGTQIDLFTPYLELNPAAKYQPGGSKVLNFSTSVQDVVYRPVASLALKAGGDIVVNTGAQIGIDPLGSLNLSSDYGSIYLDGTLSAPAGTISLTLAAGNIPYNPVRAIWLGNHARILAQGSVDYTPNNKGLLSGVVRNGGKVILNAQQGVVASEAGALVDVSGTAGLLDVNTAIGLQRKLVGSDGGSVTVAAGEGFAFDGDVKAGVGAPGSRGGSFNLKLDSVSRGYYEGQGYSFPVQEMAVNLLPGIGTSLPAGVRFGDDLGALGGTSNFNTGRLAGFGVDNFNVTVRESAKAGSADGYGTIRFGGDQTLSLARNLVLDANQIDISAHTVNLTANYVRLGDSTPFQTSQHVATASSAGQLNVNANWIDFIGYLTLNGGAENSFTSTGDLRFLGVNNLTEYRGRLLTSSKNLNFTARQLYPASYNHFEVVNETGNITIAPNGTPGPVLSAAGELVIRAPNIVQAGVVKAPQGKLVFDASDSVTLVAGSVSSVSAEGQIVPLGTVQNASEWIYPLIGGNTDSLTRSPDKTVSIKSGKIVLAAGATVDVSGGGDVYAYEWLPGPGGSKDVLTPENTAGAFAVLPGQTGVAAPYDPLYQQELDFTPGQQVYLSGGNGLKEGSYTLLPARYALLPGAYLVSPVLKSTDMLAKQNVTKVDGSAQVAGYLVEAGSAQQDSRWSGFIVESGAQLRNRAEYKDHLASSFYAEIARKEDKPLPQLPQDAGRVSFQAGAQLVLDGIVKSLHEASARGAQVDISADKLAVVAAQGQSVPTGFVAVEASKLSGLGAESILLGGQRSQEKEGTRIAVGASEVQVSNDASAPLQVAELIITASDKINVTDGAVIEASGKGVSQHNTFLIGDATTGISGDGALLRVANGADASLVRSNTSKIASQGSLLVAAGARIGPADALTFDATKQTEVKGDVQLRENGAINIGANRISLGDTAGVSEGFILDSARLAQFAKAGKIALTSYSTVDFYGSSTLGSAGLQSLSIRAAGINGHQAGNHVTLRAKSVQLDNAAGSTASVVAPYGDGSLTVDAERIKLGANTFKVRGFGAVNLNASGDVYADGLGTLDVARDDANTAAALNITAARITASKTADYTIKTAGALTTARSASATVPASQAAAELGAKLTLEAQRIAHGGLIDLPSGQVSLHANGSGAADSVTLTAGGAILAQGKTVDFYDTQAYTPGGLVKLTSDHGAVIIEKDALVDVSATGADAGELRVAAVNGSFTVDGSVQGATSSISGEATPRQGRFSLDTGSLADFGKLNRALNQGGFTETRDIRVRTGSVDIGAGQSGANAAKAHQFTLAVDKGALTVAGEIDASGVTGGNIALYAKDDLTLNAPAILNVSATGAGQKGGKVELGTSDGTLNLTGGTVLAGGAGGKGRLTLRAPRNSSNDNVKISKVNLGKGSVVGETVVEAVRVYKNTSLDTTFSNQVMVDNDAFMANLANIKTALGKSGDANFHIRPGVEVQSSGSLTIANDLSLHTWRYDATNGVRELDPANLAAGSNTNGALESGTLTLRAGGNLQFNGSLSDGFNAAANTAKLNSGGPSWRYRLVGGADHSAANPLAVTPSEAIGDVSIAANKLVRTGTADIDVAAGRDFVLQGKNATSAVLYTAGVQGATLADFAVSSYKDPANKNFDITKASFPVNGGDIRIMAGRDVNGAITHQLFSEWLQRQGSTDATGRLLADFKPAWWVNFEKFRQGVGALGGGNIHVKAGQDVKNLSAVIPTTGRLAGVAGSFAKDGNLLITGGGNLRVEAGRDLLSGVFLAANGRADLRALRDVKEGRYVKDTAGGQYTTDTTPIHTIVGMMNSQVTIEAGRELKLETAVNPTVIAQDSSVIPTNKDTVYLLGKTAPQRTYLYTYTRDDRLNLQALMGNLALVNNSVAVKNAFATKIGTQNFLPDYGIGFGHAQTYTIYPSSLNATALQGKLSVEGSFTLYPDKTGNLVLRAHDSVSVPFPVVLSDADPALLLNPFFAPQVGKLHGPDYYSSGTRSRLNGYNSGQLAHASTPIHTGDKEPVRITALNGDITGSFDLSKQARFYAGGDIKDLNLLNQHTGADDVTSVVAGGSVKYTLQRAASGGLFNNYAKLETGGPGTLYVQAGEDIDLGNSAGIVTKGDLINLALPAQGANITLMSGVKGQPAYSGFMAAYLSASERSSAADWVRTTLAKPGLSEADALAAFSTLPEGQQLASPVARLAQARFYQILGQAGRDKNNGKRKPYSSAYAAIEALFPGTAGQTRATSPGHDITLLYSQIKTEDGGDAWMFVPRGQVNAGQTSAQALSKEQDQLGIVVQDIGSIRAFVDQDFLVNQSKVFTLRGTPTEQGKVSVSETNYQLLQGDILIWSSHGDIDAGKGAKSAISAPPPLLLTDPSSGETILKYTSVSGSGIRSFKTNKTDSSGLVSLVAPEGTVNAGDAGIGAQNINIAAAQVVGVGNIQVSGLSSGVPTVSADGIAGSIGNVGNPGGDAAKATDSVNKALVESSKAAQSLKDALKPSFVSVEVVGYGE